jgi:hypothetical protein
MKSLSKEARSEKESAFFYTFFYGQKILKEENQ